MRRRSINSLVHKDKVLDNEFFGIPLLFGNDVSLTMDGTYYTFKGNFGGNFVKTLNDKFLPSKKTNALFKKLTNTEITIAPFFMLELYIIINTMVEDKKIYYKVNKKALANLVITIHTKTWFKPDTMIEYTYALNMDRVNKTMALQYKDYQFAMFKRYEYLKNKLGYLGMLLDVATGGGKTYMGLSLVEAVEADVVFIVTIKQNLQTTWVDALLDDSDPSKYYFKNKIKEEDVYTVDDYNKGKPYNGAKYVIFNYEALDKLYRLVDTIKYKNCSFIVDEAHNFVSLKSNRREELIKVIEKTGSTHRFFLTGTAVKDSPLDMIIYIELLDPRATKETLKIYREIYGSPNKMLKEIVPIRYGDLAIKVEKHELKLDPIEYITLDVAIDKPERYSLANIKQDMIAYFDKRTKEIFDNRKKDRDRFDFLIKKVRSKSSIPSYLWEKYLADHTEVRKLYDSNSMYLKPTLAKEVFNFEKDNIVANLVGPEKEEFKDLTVILKYPVLKVRGEVLGRVVLQARINCHKEMAEKIDYSILNTTTAKSVVMSSYIPVCEAATVALLKQGFKPIEIYGKFTKDQDNRIRLFKNDPDVDPMVGTLKSISTAHHFTVADIVFLLDTPFRTYILDQAIARAWRTGQTENVKVIHTRLKLNVDNINSRNIDILKWAKSMVEEITGNDISYLDFDKGKVLDNIDLEGFYFDPLEAKENKEFEMKRTRLKLSAYANNNTVKVDNEGMLSNLVDKVKNWFKKKEDSKKKKDVIVDCESELAYTTIKQLTGNTYGPWQMMYDIIIDDCENDADIGGLVATMEDRVKEIDKAIADGSKKVANRKLKESEYDSELFDPKWGFKEERSYLKYAYECNESTIKYINDDIWANDNEKDKVDPKNIKELHRLNKLMYNKILEVIKIIEKGIKVNKIDVESMEGNIDAEGIKDVFKWIKDIATSDKSKMKDYGVKTTYGVYNILNYPLQEIFGDYFDRKIIYLDNEDSSIKLPIDLIKEASDNINSFIKSNQKSYVFTLDTEIDDKLDNYTSKVKTSKTHTMNIGLTLMKNKKLSDGYAEYIDLLNKGIKTYKDDKEGIKALTDLKKSIESLMSYIDSNVKLVKIDNSKLDRETFNSIDIETINPDDEFIELKISETIEKEPDEGLEESDVVDKEAIIVPILIASSAYLAYKIAEEKMIRTYGVKKDIDFESFDTNNGQTHGEITLNHIANDILEMSELITSTDKHILKVASDNIRVADLESFDVFRGLASAGLNKVNKAIDKLKVLLKTNNQDYKEIGKNDVRMDKEIAIPKGYVGNLLNASEDILKASINITNLKSNIETTIVEISGFINSESLRESSILKSNFIKILDKNAEDLYNLNTKYLTASRVDRCKVYDLISNTNDIALINTNLRNASKLINNSELMGIKNSLSMIDELVKAVVSNQDKFSKIKMKELGLIIDHLISYVSGVATLVYLKNSVDIMLDNIRTAIKE